MPLSFEVYLHRTSLRICGLCTRYGWAATAHAAGGHMANRFISRGFVGKRRAPDVANRVPPGQYLTPDFPVLSAGPTPRTPLDRWSFTIQGLVSQPVTWTWAEFLQLPTQTFVVDIHCVTK